MYMYYLTWSVWSWSSFWLFPQGDSDQVGRSVPDDITAYYEKMDNEDEENDDQVHIVYNLLHVHVQK